MRQNNIHASPHLSNFRIPVVNFPPNDIQLARPSTAQRCCYWLSITYSPMAIKTSLSFNYCHASKLYVRFVAWRSACYAITATRTSANLANSSHNSLGSTSSIALQHYTMPLIDLFYKRMLTFAHRCLRNEYPPHGSLLYSSSDLP